MPVHTLPRCLIAKQCPCQGPAVLAVRGLCSSYSKPSAVVLWGRQVEKGWSKENASLKGASILLVPWCLKWFTMGIECALPDSPRLASPR